LDEALLTTVEEGDKTMPVLDGVTVTAPLSLDLVHVPSAAVATGSLSNPLKEMVTPPTPSP